MRRTHFLHIGKTGGTAMKVALGPYLTGIPDRDVVLRPHETTLTQIPAGEQVFFILRDPIDRFVSGFNSRRRRGPPHRIEWNPAEIAAFTRFATPNDLAAALSAADEQEQAAAASAMRGIRHVNTFYADWLGELDYLRTRQPDILWVGLTSQLSENFAELRQVLRLPPSCKLPDDPLQAHRGPDTDPTWLSESGRANIAAWYADDYAFLDHFFGGNWQANSAFRTQKPWLRTVSRLAARILSAPRTGPATSNRPEGPVRAARRETGNRLKKPEISVVVVVHNIPREAPRTLFSLSAAYQRDIDAAEYEVVVVDNGSQPPVDRSMIEGLAGNFRVVRIDPAPASPAHAINRGLAEASGDIIGVMIDGARMATPGLMHFARHGARLYQTAIVTPLGWHLGSDFQRFAAEGGYDRAREDALLESIAWPEEGYRLFEIGTVDESSTDGWLQPIPESTALFLSRDNWTALGGWDEQFDAPGGGFLNIDTFRRAMELPGARLVILLGEGTFHQLHGGVATNATPARLREDLVGWAAQYEHIRGKPQEVVRPGRPPTYLGTLPAAELAQLTRAALEPARHRAPPLGESFDRTLWTPSPTVRPADPVIASLVDLAHTEFGTARYPAAAAVARLARARAPDEPEPQRLLRLVGCWLTQDGPPETARAHYHLALAKAHHRLGEFADAEKHYRAAHAADPNLEEARELVSMLRLHGTSRRG